jgi:hypothetical protein
MRYAEKLLQCLSLSSRLRAIRLCIRGAGNTIVRTEQVESY